MSWLGDWIGGIFSLSSQLFDDSEDELDVLRDAMMLTSPSLLSNGLVLTISNLDGFSSVKGYVIFKTNELEINATYTSERGVKWTRVSESEIRIGNKIRVPVTLQGGANDKEPP